jgi:hypothetical protein
MIKLTFVFEVLLSFYRSFDSGLSLSLFDYMNLISVAIVKWATEQYITVSYNLSLKIYY